MSILLNCVRYMNCLWTINHIKRHTAWGVCIFAVIRKPQQRAPSLCTATVSRKLPRLGPESYCFQAPVQYYTSLYGVIAYTEVWISYVFFLNKNKKKLEQIYFHVITFISKDSLLSSCHGWQIGFYIISLSIYLSFLSQKTFFFDLHTKTICKNNNLARCFY